MENPDLRKSMGMESHQKGVRIRRIEPTAPESQVLKPSDIILSFDGVNIANDGTGNNSYSQFTYLSLFRVKSRHSLAITFLFLSWIFFSSI